LSRISYYYDPPGSNTIVYKPGECCNGCGVLARIMPAGSMVPMPSDGLHEEYGHSEGDIHMHLECAEAALAEYKRLYEEAKSAIDKFKEPQCQQS